MTRPDSIAGCLSIVSRGEADAPQREQLDPRALAAVRYADPAAWVIATAVARALAPVKEQLATAGDQVGVVVTGAQGPVETITTVATAAREGFTSPLRFPAANPGSLAGVTCIAFGVRGPSLSLLLPPAEGVPLGLLLASAWIHRGVVPFVVLAACSRGESGRPVARSLLLARGDLESTDCRDAFAWLASAPNERQAEES
jgi:hypothetical protein